MSSGPLHDWWSRIMFASEGPRHRRLRDVVQTWLTPWRVARLADPVAVATRSALADVSPYEEFDLAELRSLADLGELLSGVAVEEWVATARLQLVSRFDDLVADYEASGSAGPVRDTLAVVETHAARRGFAATAGYAATSTRA